MCFSDSYVQNLPGRVLSEYKDHEMLPCSASNSTSLPLEKCTLLHPIKSLKLPCSKNEEDLKLFIDCFMEIYSDRASSIMAKQLLRGPVIFKRAEEVSTFLVILSQHLAQCLAQPVCAWNMYLFGRMKQWSSQACCVYILCVLCSL